MKEFILEDNFLKSIKKHANELDNYYLNHVDDLFFYKLKYDAYYLSIIHPKKRTSDLNDFRTHVPLFKEMFEENKDIIISSANIGRMPGFSDKSVFLAHRHLVDVDAKIYHYILKCNDKSGMIIGNDCMRYEKGMAFGFNSDKSHIAFNFGETIKDSFIFIVLNEKYSLDEYFDKKFESAINNDYPMKEINKKYALRKIKKLTGI